MALGIAGLGLWYALARGHRTVGLSIFAGAVAWVLVALFVIVPAFSGGSSPYFGAYDEVGGRRQASSKTHSRVPGSSSKRSAAAAIFSTSPS